MIEVDLRPSWLVADLGAPRRVLSFAPYRSGFATAQHVVWREVRDADLTPDLNVEDWFARDLAAHGHPGAVGLLTSRDVSRFVRTDAEVEGAHVACLATVGLGNAEAVGSRRAVNGVGWSTQYGTINILVQIDAGLSEAAQIEALTIATQARTAAVLACGLALPDGRRATGTGTDCIAIAADPGTVAFAGLHTALGEAIGRAVLAAVTKGAADWVSENGGTARGYP
ncbi:MAG: adenosylcobinamide amidohydrolase [Pseudotabrizicola sp.]|uniref:adenosylcobinamide amidohydrolase n=1 Tax=Pseudotabrizicola sp. TaxID=2939647 RepID=UPI00271880D0|nr:adenosylcobinamide amidohydrolase [Pseudotabrizicola sp.]MDO8884709.1 adenosylcobinamide amidohydrolase [Pseudotabrizicola sp.]MDP2082559.1 adenosylcobinamide amidohydrolase [Pseudotabrizicola sp.]MDZ7573930.1 adenosylcobinamide amidohydrolase [Pseudotabrizicola sp.]